MSGLPDEGAGQGEDGGATYWSGTAGNMPVVDVGEAVDRAREAGRLMNEAGQRAEDRRLERAVEFFNQPIGTSDGDMSGEWLERRMAQADVDKARDALTVFLEVPDASSAPTDALAALTAFETVVREDERAKEETARLDYAREVSATFAEFRAHVRGALFAYWPNNLGVGDNEIIDAIKRATADAQAYAALTAAAQGLLDEVSWALTLDDVKDDHWVSARAGTWRVLRALLPAVADQGGNG